MKKNVGIAVVGLGGYGEVYLEGLLEKPQDQCFQVVAGIDPQPQRCSRLPMLNELKIPLFDSLESFYEKGGEADLVILSSPIQLHSIHTRLALENGSNVLCEKPLAGSIQEAQEMIDVRDRSGKFVAIGYQWSFTDTIQALKHDYLEGRFGRPIRLKTLALWPRDESYYKRNNWAGRKKGADGRWVLDSPVNNAVAHYLHNMLFVIGDRFNLSARPKTVLAELYRANAIENYDTATLRVFTDSNVEILFVVSHAVPEMTGPIKEYEFENAVLRFDGLFSHFVAEFRNGDKKDYGSPDPQQIKKMWDCIRAVRTGEEIACGPEAAREQTRVMNGAQESMAVIVDFPSHLIHTSGEPGKTLTICAGLEKELTACYQNNQLLSERDIDWASAGKPIDLSSYTHFPSLS
ncbi:Gfo/Idh/MocA family oxidoreductase [candidate division KSB1 bacterium]|nr:Gfo/Idh/MocA family oxidoreductase [candidate division KSB1 bacterium]